jgi:hypothetical protein
LGHRDYTVYNTIIISQHNLRFPRAERISSGVMATYDFAQPKNKKQNKTALPKDTPALRSWI